MLLSRNKDSEEGTTNTTGIVRGPHHPPQLQVGLHGPELTHMVSAYSANLQVALHCTPPPLLTLVGTFRLTYRKSKTLRIQEQQIQFSSNLFHLVI